ncbi:MULTISPECIES: DUF2383 domain-containing protein [unclassified Yoonia]|uniref:DUF2383 domain-containing protein n=1 Tax=unclassified Yoonia TaxID=2629118 RepID=UPI002AFDE3B2|nr:MULTISPECIES: DUF2383 domain-containing protein [unclassified Yoonia]
MHPTEFKNLQPQAADDSALRPAGPQPEPHDERLDLIAKVYTSVLDTISGFDKLVEKAEPSFKPAAQEFLTMHSRHEGVLAAYLAQAGRVPDDDGSFFGTINRAVIEARSWFEDVDRDVMDRVAEGEEQVLETYAEARDVGQTIEANAMLTDQMAEITALLRKNGV